MPGKQPPSAAALTVAGVRKEAARQERRRAHQWRLKREFSWGGMSLSLLASSIAETWSERKRYEEVMKFWSLFSFWSRSSPLNVENPMWKNKPSEAAIRVASVRTAAAWEERVRITKWRMRRARMTKGKVEKTSPPSTAPEPTQMDNNTVKSPTKTGRPSQSSTPFT